MGDGAKLQIGLTPAISAALQGTDGDPSNTNRYVTDSDPRLTGGDVSSEEAARIAADVVLQDNIDAEQADREAADVGLASDISTEASARIAADALKANIASPTFTGNPAAPTPSPGDNDTSLATTAFVQAALSGFSGDPAMGGDLSGTASNAQIVADAVTAAEIAAGAVGASEVASALKPSGSAAAGDEALRALGTGAGTAAAGNDSRLSDSRTPSGSAGGDLTGTYPNPTIGAGKVTLAQLAAAIKPSGSAAAGDEAVRALGTGAGNAAAGNDSRLSDSRAPSGSAGGGLTGTYPNPTIATDAVGSAQIAADAVTASEIAAGAVAASEVSATLKPTGSAATTDEALRALGTTAGTAAAGNDSRLSPERVMTTGKAGSVTTTTDDADFYKAAPCALTLLRMKVSCRSVTTSMVVQLRKSTDSGANWSDVTGFTVTFASGDKIKVVDPSNVNLNEGDLLNFVCSTVSGFNLLIDVVWVQQ